MHKLRRRKSMQIWLSHMSPRNISRPNRAFVSKYWTCITRWEVFSSVCWMSQQTASLHRKPPTQTHSDEFVMEAFWPLVGKSCLLQLFWQLTTIILYEPQVWELGPHITLDTVETASERSNRSWQHRWEDCLLVGQRRRRMAAVHGDRRSLHRGDHKCKPKIGQSNNQWLHEHTDLWLQLPL